MASITVTFDTLDASRRLREAGFSELQANTAVQVITDAQNRLTTKEDLVILKQELIIKLGGTVIACTVTILGALRWMH
jgi:hypothetical protein